MHAFGWEQCRLICINRANTPVSGHIEAVDTRVVCVVVVCEVVCIEARLVQRWRGEGRDEVRGYLRY
jgi:hypothetical protein